MTRLDNKAWITMINDAPPVGAVRGIKIDLHYFALGGHTLKQRCTLTFKHAVGTSDPRTNTTLVC